MITIQNCKEFCFTNKQGGLWTFDEDSLFEGDLTIDEASEYAWHYTVDNGMVSAYFETKTANNCDTFIMTRKIHDLLKNKSRLTQVSITDKALGQKVWRGVINKSLLDSQVNPVRIVNHG